MPVIQAVRIVLCAAKGFLVDYPQAEGSDLLARAIAVLEQKNAQVFGVGRIHSRAQAPQDSAAL